MANPQPHILGEMIANDKNRSELQVIIDFSASLLSSTISRSNPVITFKLSSYQTWSANSERPLTICTAHTPLDVKIPGQFWSGSPLGSQIASLGEHHLYKRLVHGSSAFRHNYGTPTKKDWQEVLGFVTVLASNTKRSYAIDREVDISSFSPSQQPNLEIGKTVQLKLVDWEFENTPGIRWWNWGSLEDDLKRKKLRSRTDPVLNGKERDEERKHLHTDLVLSYDDWKDVEDDEGNEMVRLELVFDDTPMSVKVVE